MIIPSYDDLPRFEHATFTFHGPPNVWSITMYAGLVKLEGLRTMWIDRAWGPGELWRLADLVNFGGYWWVLVGTFLSGPVKSRRGSCHVRSGHGMPWVPVERPRWLHAFYAKCAKDEMRPVIQNPPLTHRTPMFIIDQRFAGRKREKSYVCDNCQLPVPNSSVKRFFRNRYLSYINRYLSYISAKRKPTMLISFEWAK